MFFFGIGEKGGSRWRANEGKRKRGLSYTSHLIWLIEKGGRYVPVCPPTRGVKLSKGKRGSWQKGGGKRFFRRFVPQTKEMLHARNGKEREIAGKDIAATIKKEIACQPQTNRRGKRKSVKKKEERTQASHNSTPQAVRKAGKPKKKAINFV